MWLYNQPPRQQLKERYQFEAQTGWLDHLMKSSVRFNVGGSGSFVSADGLVMTNHHVAADAIQKLSGPGRDLLTQGFIAKNRTQELPCVDLELNVLQSIEDVSAQIQAVIQPGMDTGQAEKAKRAAINTLEEEEGKRSGLRCDVVTLFKGGAYHLYRYKRYTDVRLVFAPELGIAFFGGDSDNFEYPRQCLDVTFFRVYEDGKPVRPANYLHWAPKGVQEGDLVFVSGHPGRTNRLNTVSHLKFFRDIQYPFVLNYLRRLEVLLNTYGERSSEHHRQAQDERFGVQNGRKARLGGLQGLQDPAVMAEKSAREELLRQSVSSKAALQAAYGSAWSEVDQALQTQKAIFMRHAMLEQARGFNSQLFHYARVLVRRSLELQKPNADRLREFGDANKSSLEQDLFSTAPHYAQFEEAKLANSLGLLVEQLGAEDPTVLSVLSGKSPLQRASELVAGTRLGEVEVRKQMASMTAEALKASADPMIALAWLIEDEARTLRDQYDKKVSQVMEQAYAKIARASLEAAGGQSLYPDATFTLRLAFGVVSGYAGIPYTTDFASLYAKSDSHHGIYPFNLPPRWLAARKKVNLKTPFDFVCTADIIGGNSGSPVVNRSGQVVGLIFDGNLDSLVLDFQYSQARARALAVDSRAILEALRKVYGCNSLADELQRGQ
jgi:hypothetical protein